MQSGIRWKMPRRVWKTSRLVPPSHQPLGDKEDSENPPTPFLSEITHHTHTCTRNVLHRNTPAPRQDSPVALWFLFIHLIDLF